MEINMREIQLTQGQVAIVDDEDYEELNKYKWYARYNKGTKSFYAFRNSSRKKGRHTLSMHRCILGLKKGDETIAHHHNHNTLDNRKSNLKVVTSQENNRHAIKRANYTSKYKGVSWHKECKKWQAKIQVSKKNNYLGIFTDEQEAAKAYNEAALKHFGEFALLNKI